MGRATRVQDIRGLLPVGPRHYRTAPLPCGGPPAPRALTAATRIAAGAPGHGCMPPVAAVPCRWCRGGGSQPPPYLWSRCRVPCGGPVRTRGNIRGSLSRRGLFARPLLLRWCRRRRIGTFLEQLRHLDAQRLRGMPQRQCRRITPAKFQRTDISSVDAHPCRDCVLRQVCCQTVSPNIFSNNTPHIHAT